MINPKFSLDSICFPSESIVSREIEGEIIIIPLVAGIGHADDELYTLNKTGQAIWRLLDGARSLGEVAAILYEEYNTQGEELLEDVLGFATEMVSQGILTILNNPDKSQNH